MRKRIMKSLFWKFTTSTGLVIQYGCVIHCIFQYVGEIVLCSGPSMEPTIFTDDIIITEHITPKFRQIQKNDIVIVKCPHNPHQNICKRVKGLPGDKVYTKFGSKEIVPVGHIWLEGDNASNSTDSRNYGAVPQGLIKSRVLLRVYPFSNMTSL